MISVCLGKYDHHNWILTNQKLYVCSHKKCQAYKPGPKRELNEHEQKMFRQWLRTLGKRRAGQAKREDQANRDVCKGFPNHLWFRTVVRKHCQRCGKTKNIGGTSETA